ncbi:class I SAM-dependent methyltransferase [Alphaproteobacteria bacterium]|nr:class I SAM-dependent methyltransferase [Alphaproteobacteria bacterium]
MKKILMKIYLKEELNPKIIGLFLPNYFVAKEVYRNMCTLVPELTGRLLDIGCGTKPFEFMFNVDEYIGLEIDDKGRQNHTHADILYDGEVIPLEDKSFDSVFSSEVLEHVFNPDTFLKETNRVMKLDGLFLLSTPFFWEEHAQPYDYARYTSFGLRYILEKNGFEVIKQVKCGNGIEVVFQTISNYIFRTFKWKYPFRLIVFLLILPINLIGLVLSKILPKNNDMYLDNIILAKKIKEL